MTIMEILEQAKKLTQWERDQLVERLQAMQETTQPERQAEGQEEHWGRNLLRLLDELEPLEIEHPDIEDTVEWVKQIRRDEQKRRLGDWGEDE